MALAMLIEANMLVLLARLWALADNPQLALKVFDTDGTLATICYRESKCDPTVDFHASDYGNGKSAWLGAVMAGGLDPSHCAFHSYQSGYAWSTRALYEQIAAYAIPYAGCVPPEILRVAFIDTWIAAQRLARSRRPGAPKALRGWAKV